jgi:hypothetical protein
MPSRWKFKSRAPPRGRRPRVAGSGVWAPLLYAHRMVLSPRAGYRITKKTGRAVNRTIKQTKTAISILLPQCLATDRGFRRRGFLTYDTRAGGPRFIRARGWAEGAALPADGLRVGVGHPLAVAGDQGGAVAVDERVAESGGAGDVDDALGSVAPDPRASNPCGHQNCGSSSGRDHSRGFSSVRNHSCGGCLSRLSIR